jgi:hypothetical protein
MCTLITSKGTDIDENIANQNHATRTRTPKPGYLNLSNVQFYSGPFVQFLKLKCAVTKLTKIALIKTSLLIYSLPLWMLQKIPELLSLI